MKVKLTESKLKAIIKEAINEEIENRRYNAVFGIVKEEINKWLEGKINEDKDEETVKSSKKNIHKKSDKKSKKNKDDVSFKRKAVMDLLKDPKLDHAQIAYKLYGVKNPEQNKKKAANARWKISFKSREAEDADGNVRRFSDKEIAKLYNILTS